MEFNNIDINNNIITIRPDQSKTGNDGITRNVIIHPKLQSTLIKYMGSYENAHPSDKLFHHSRRKDREQAITSMSMRAYWRGFFAEVQNKYSDKFNRDGLSLYGFKHSGVTHFYYDNINKNTSDKLLDFIKKQCRHKSITTTEKYLRDDLGIDIDGSATFYQELGIQ